LVSVDYLTNAWVDCSDFLWLIEGDWRKVPFVDRQAAILDFVSVDYLTNGWVDCSDFFVAYWGWLEEGSSRWLVPQLIQDGTYDLVSIDSLTRNARVRYFCGLLGVTGGRFLSITSATAHSRGLPCLSKVTEGKILN
jgi:hypothetical protein